VNAPATQAPLILHLSAVVGSPLRDADRKGGALKKLTVLATGEVFTANIREQEKPGLE